MKILQLLVLSALILLFALYIQPSQDEIPGTAQPATGDVEPLVVSNAELAVVSGIEPAAVSGIEPADIRGPASSPLQWVRPQGQLWHRLRSR
jgi:hypothetical protein